MTLPTETLKLALSPDRKTGAALSLGCATLFSTETGQVFCSLATVDSAQADFAFLDDDTFIYAGTDGLSVYKISEGKIAWTGEACEKIAVSANGASIAAASVSQQHAVVYTPEGQVRSILRVGTCKPSPTAGSQTQKTCSSRSMTRETFLPSASRTAL